jgi:excisionase family DNA binding protein
MDSKSLALQEKDPECILKLKELNSLIMMILSPFLTFNEACNYLHCSESGLKKLCKQNHIPHYNTAERKIYFDKEDLDKWIKSKPNTKTKK